MKRHGEDAPIEAAMRANAMLEKGDLWHARLAVKTLRRDEREAIAAAAED